MYRTRHIDRKILSLFVACSSILASYPCPLYASNSGEKLPPLRVYIPNATSFINYFATDNMQYNPSDAILTAIGNVQVEQGDVVLTADALEYNQKENILLASGDVAMVDANGKVTFFDKVELNNAIKEGIVNKFKSQMINNDEFMAAEAKKPAGHRAHYADNKKSFLDRMVTYLTPDFLVKNSMADAEKFANLEPAAGGDAAAPENNPVIGTVPLIALENKTTAPAEPKTPEATLDTKVVGEPSKEAGQANTPVKAEETPSAATTAPTPAASAQDPTPAKAAEKKTATEETKKEAEKAVVAKAEDKTIDDIVTKGTEEEKKKEPEKKSEVKPDVKKTAAKKSDPDPALSPKSREVLNKIKPPKAKKEKYSPPFKVDRSHDMQDLFKGNETAPVGSVADPLGVKVDRKKQNVNIDYELEQAYNATVSGQSEAAMTAYQTVLANAPNNTEALFGLATLYHRARQFDKARPLYAKLLSIDPDHRDGFNNFLVLLADEAPREALVELEKLETKNPGFSTIPAQMAVIYQKLGDSDKAIGKMFRAVSLAPENLTYRYNLAIMLDKQKNYDEAAKLYKQLIEASDRGEKIPGNISNIQQRLTFISSNRP